MAMGIHEARGAVGQPSKRALLCSLVDGPHHAVERTARRFNARVPTMRSTGIRTSSEGLAPDPLHPPDVAGMGSGEVT